MGVDKKNHRKNAANDPWELSKLMAVAPTLPPMASATPTCGTADTSPVCYFPDKPPPKPDAT